MQLNDPGCIVDSVRKIGNNAWLDTAFMRIFAPHKLSSL